MSAQFPVFCVHIRSMQLDYSLRTINRSRACLDFFFLSIRRIEFCIQITTLILGKKLFASCLAIQLSHVASTDWQCRVPDFEYSFVWVLHLFIIQDTSIGCVMLLQLLLH